MRDMFDEFMEELRRRQAELEGRDPGRPKQGDADDDGSDEEGSDDEGSDDEGSDADRSDEEPADGEEEPGQRVEDDPAAGEGSSGEPDQGRSTGPEGLGGPREPGRSQAGRRPPPRRPRPVVVGDGPRRSGRAWLLWGIFAFVVVALLLLIGPGIDLITDVMWYQSVGYESVFWTRLGTQFWLFVGIFVVSLALLLADLWLANRLAPPPPEQGSPVSGWFARFAEAARESQTRGNWESPFGGPGRGRPPGRVVVMEPPELPDLTPIATIGLVAVAVLIALGLAGAASSAWETFLLWRNQVPYSPVAAVTPDPVFGRDISFFLFELPFLRLVQSLVNGLILGALLIAGGRYVVAAMRGGFSFPTSVRVHLAVLGALYLVSVAAGYQLDKFELVYANNGVATGISYTDANARFFALDLLTIIAALAAALLVGGAFTRLIWPLGGAVLVWVGAAIIVGTVYPEVIQRFVVAPNPYANEQPYIQFNMDMTRKAYALDTWTADHYGGDAPLTEQALRDEADTFTNARLWDYRPLGTTIDQLQTVRQYYDFVDVDTDRYQVQDLQRQVMLSGRELDISKSNITLNWLNQRIIYTHGMGLVMTPVNEVTAQGQPHLWIRDLPPTSSNGAPTITQPRIYFGEITNDYVITGAKQAEFDYPSGQTAGAGGSGDTGVEYRWTGQTGIKLDTMLDRLLYAIRFRDLNILISEQLTSDSQLLFHRSLGDRLPRIAPFLRYDKDPYLVVTGDGRLVYIQDAYTTSDRFPNAEYFDPGQLQRTGLGGGAFNYIRNSVKIVVDAYDGRTSFYISDPNDPIIRAYAGVFPGLFKPMEQLPSDLQSHLRVPEEQFDVQTLMFGRYHVTNPLTFFQRDDLWMVPTGQASDQSLPTEAYYVIMRMPGKPKAEFLLLQPMVPVSRPNMIAWVAAQNDGQDYGKVRYYQFPSNTSIFGPVQVEALIDQDPVISSQFTLWNQSGSTVIRGNLLVVPVGDSILYLQPVYLQSTASAFPEFQKIVVASPTAVVWADTLEQALRQLLATEGPGPSPSPSPGAPSPSPTPRPSVGPGQSPPAGDVQALVEYANTHFELAQEALRNGDFATYGSEMQLVQAALAQLGQLVGTPRPSTAPSVAPSVTPSVGPSPSP